MWGDECELAHTRSGLRAIFSTVKGSILGSGRSGDFVSQRREKRKAWSQGSFDWNEDESARSQRA